LPEVITQWEEIEAGRDDKRWVIIDGIIIRDGRVFMLASSVAEGVQKTLHQLRASFFTPHDARLVHEFIKGCSICQRNKTEHLHPASLLQPLVMPTLVWSDITMDFMEGFPKVSDKSMILAIVDKFSKMAHFLTLGHPYSALTVAKVFFNQIIRLHGLLMSIISDQDPMFTSNVWLKLFRLLGMQLQMSLVFRPQTDGQSEVNNRNITVYLHCLIGDSPKSWLRCLLWAEYCYNTSYQTTLRSTPF
jgi:hypothetical protein